MNKFLKILSPILVIIVIALGVLFYLQNKDLKETTIELDAIVEEMEFEKQEAIEEFEKINLEFQNYAINNDSLLNLIGEEQQKVQQLLQELKTVKATNARRIRELQKELGTVRTVLKAYIVKYDSLNTVNTNLKKENYKVKRQFEDTKQIVKQMEEKTAELDEKITMAAILEAENISIKTLNKYGRNTRRLSKIINFEINFQVLRNITAQRGEKTIYLRISGPTQQLMTAAGNNYFMFEENNLEFSASKKIEYNGENTDVKMYYRVTDKLEKGTYMVHIFADGNLIGNTGFIIK